MYVAFGVIGVVEMISYLSTGNFIWCQRYGGGCWNMTPLAFFKFVLFVIALLLTIRTFYRNTKIWAEQLRQYMLETSMSVYGDSFGWDSSFSRTLSKILILWFGFMAIVIAFSAIFGTV